MKSLILILACSFFMISCNKKDAQDHSGHDHDHSGHSHDSHEGHNHGPEEAHDEHEGHDHGPEEVHENGPEETK